jgi:hypothetical protein
MSNKFNLSQQEFLEHAGLGKVIPVFLKFLVVTRPQLDFMKNSLQVSQAHFYLNQLNKVFGQGTASLVLIHGQLFWKQNMSFQLLTRHLHYRQDHLPPVSHLMLLSKFNQLGLSLVFQSCPRLPLV